MKRLLLFLRTADKKIILAASLMLISLLGWIIPLFVLPWLDLSLKEKALATTFWLIFGQVTYNIGFVIAGVKVWAIFKKWRAKRRDQNKK